MARVLLIDDSKLARRKCRELLSDKAHEILDAEGGREGLEVAEQESPDVIVLDLLMPGLSGEETLKILRQRHPSIPVIVMTADPQKQTAEECLALGAAEVINKFDDPDDLENAVNKVLGGRE